MGGHDGKIMGDTMGRMWDSVAETLLNVASLAKTSRTGNPTSKLHMA